MSSQSVIVVKLTYSKQQRESFFSTNANTVGQSLPEPRSPSLSGAPPFGSSVSRKRPFSGRRALCYSSPTVCRPTGKAPFRSPIQSLPPRRRSNHQGRKTRSGR
ncbi:hypothetical protein CDAR_76471 [Caerostris darwini]|uniref:Uncharacterized protein n=1 Tax=Caerostris darwini TaxID=1538125 RepID=A0AAV4QEV0_9ARAC|nr:hypothetical protein CDAR_76471 [Caerostris darwini]